MVEWIKNNEKNRWMVGWMDGLKYMEKNGWLDG